MSEWSVPAQRTVCSWFGMGRCCHEYGGVAATHPLAGSVNERDAPKVVGGRDAVNQRDPVDGRAAAGARGS